MAMADLYKKLNWAYTYSFFILMTMYLIAYWLTQLKSFTPISSGKDRREKEIHLVRRREKAR
ncbi:hypothetical protein D3C72_2207290 [compost metagenome]